MLKEIKYGALSGKARAMFGKLLSKNDYKILIQKKRIAQVVSYLKHNTHYSGLLSDTDENNIHRVKLEILLKKDIINDYSKFFKFTNGRLKEFVKHYCTKAEIESLKLIFRMFEGGNTEHGLLEESLLFLSRHDKLDIPKLSLSRDLEEFLSRLHGTDYYKLLKPFISDNK
jgi:V/A-type H+-transporting ATPase subunit C